MGNPFHSFWAGLYPGTRAELALEPYIAALGYPYRTQFPYFLWGLKFFPDYALITVGLIIEVDDDSHNDPEKREKDATRTSSLEALGWRVLRFTNEQALDNPGRVANEIETFLRTEGVRDLSHLFPPKPSKRARRRRSPRTTRRRAAL